MLWIQARGRSGSGPWADPGSPHLPLRFTVLYGKMSSITVFFAENGYS